MSKAFTAKGASGAYHVLLFHGWRDGRAYMTTVGCAAYLADPLTGRCDGVEGSVGQTLALVPNALRRLFQMWECEGGSV